MFCLSVTSEIILNIIVRLIDCLFRLITFFASEAVELPSNSGMFIKIHICFPFMFLTLIFYGFYAKWCQIQKWKGGEQKEQ